MITIAFSGFIATIGFGILFNIKGYKLLLAGIGGMLSSIVYMACMNNAVPEVVSLFLASVSFSIYSEILARYCHTPVTTFIICALIPLVPGRGMYETMKFAVDGKVIYAMQKGMETLTNAGALALGIVFVSTIVRSLFRHKHKDKQ